MSKTEQQLRSMYLSGTVSIPARFPDVADISYSRNEGEGGPFFVTATQQLSRKVVIRRTFFAQDVMSLFIPHNAQQVDFEQGTWLEGAALAEKLSNLLGKTSTKGIIYVREFAQSILEMEAGLTAAESAQYYPPLPEDRSVDHYDMSSKGAFVGCD